MYIVRPTDNGSWQVLGENEHVLFCGTKKQCEDWLDCDENREAAHVKAASPGLLKRFANLFRRSSLKPET